jgi:putative transposase
VALRDAIELISLAMPGYSHRRVTHAFHRAGGAVIHQRVLRVMRQGSLRCQLKRRFVGTTISAHRSTTYPNLLIQTVLTAPTQAWGATITDVRLPTTLVYLACRLDASSRRCVGWQLSRQMDSHFTLAALQLALTQRRPPPGLIHHSDRGVHYASAEYVPRLDQAGIPISMSAKGTPYDNAQAKAERFCKTLNREQV